MKDWLDYESIAETLEIMSDEAAFNALKAGIQQFKNGELVDFEGFKQSIDVKIKFAEE